MICRYRRALRLTWLALACWVLAGNVVLCGGPGSTLGAVLAAAGAVVTILAAWVTWRANRS